MRRTICSLGETESVQWGTGCRLDFRPESNQTHPLATSLTSSVVIGKITDVKISKIFLGWSLDLVVSKVEMAKGHICNNMAGYIGSWYAM